MNDSVRKFCDMLSSSADMQKRIAELDRRFAETHAVPSPDTGAEAVDSFRKQAIDEIVIPVAKEAGFEFTSDDLLSFRPGQADQELSTDELQAVAGGDGGYEVGGLFACEWLGIGFGTTNENNEICFIVGTGSAACAMEGSPL